MKTIGTKLTRLVLIILQVILLFNCTASKLQVTTLNLKPQPYTTIEVMPFAEAKKRLASTDVHQRGLLGMIINEHTGIYTYVFDDIDYSNLRKSLIESLQKGNYFRAVNDIANVSESGKGTRLYIDFSESGIIHSESGFMNLNKKAHCILNAYAWTEYPNGNLRTKKEITIEESSGISVADAKNKAILKFIEEISTIL